MSAADAKASGWALCKGPVLKPGTRASANAVAVKLRNERLGKVLGVYPRFALTRCSLLGAFLAGSVRGDRMPKPTMTGRVEDDVLPTFSLSRRGRGRVFAPNLGLRIKDRLSILLVCVKRTVPSGTATVGGASARRRSGRCPWPAGAARCLHGEPMPCRARQLQGSSMRPTF